MTWGVCFKCLFTTGTVERSIRYPRILTSNPNHAGSCVDAAATARSRIIWGRHVEIILVSSDCKNRMLGG